MAPAWGDVTGGQTPKPQGVQGEDTLGIAREPSLFRPEGSVVPPARAEGPGPRFRRGQRPNGLAIRALTERQTPANGRAFSPPITDAAEAQGLQPWRGERMALQAERVGNPGVSHLRRPASSTLCVTSIVVGAIRKASCPRHPPAHPDGSATPLSGGRGTTELGESDDFVGFRVECLLFTCMDRSP